MSAGKRRTSSGLALVLAALAVLLSAAVFAAETDNLTYRFLRLEDSANKLNRVLNARLEEIAKRTNEKLAAKGGDPDRVSDTEVERTFDETYTEIVLRKFGDRLLPIFESCIERNDCPGWPRFERIALARNESIYGQIDYNRVAIAFLSPSFQLCGVRLGTDKLTHLFSHGFFYYNASRSKRVRLENAQEVHRMALADEKGLMGARSTAVVSPADAEATLAGYRFASEYFLGDDPVFARDARTGLLVKRRNVDICSCVSAGLDEALNPPAFTARTSQVERLRGAIAARLAFNAWAEKTLTAEEKQELKARIVSRALESSHARLPFPYKMYLVFKYAAAYLTIPKESRDPARFLVFPKFKLEDRRPIVLKREPSRSGAVGFLTRALANTDTIRAAR